MKTHYTKILGHIKMTLKEKFKVLSACIRKSEGTKTNELIMSGKIKANQIQIQQNGRHNKNRSEFEGIKAKQYKDSMNPRSGSLERKIKFEKINEIDRLLAQSAKIKGLTQINRIRDK